MDRIITFPETTLPLFLWKLVVNWQRSLRGRSRHVYTPFRANRRGGSLKQDDCNPTTAFRGIISCFGVVSMRPRCTVGLTQQRGRDAMRRDAARRGATWRDVARCDAKQGEGGYESTAVLLCCCSVVLHCSNFAFFHHISLITDRQNDTHLRASRYPDADQLFLTLKSAVLSTLCIIIGGVIIICRYLRNYLRK